MKIFLLEVIYQQGAKVNVANFFESPYKLLNLNGKQLNERTW